MADHIVIEGLQVSCIIGVHPHERDEVQPLLVDLELALDLRPAGRSGRIAETCDYAQIAVQTRALLQFRRYQLLEAAAEELCAMLLGLYEAVQTITVRLHKPQALVEFGTGAAVAIQRSRLDFPRRHEDAKFGHVDILLETKDAGLYLLHVDPGNAIPPHHHQRMRELEWLAEGELWWEEQPVASSRPVTWDKGRVHGYQNRSDTRATVFCCDVPPFIETDEIEVERS